MTIPSFAVNPGQLEAHLERYKRKEPGVSFSALKLHPSLLKGIKELGFVRPTPIQEEGIPPALEGRDLLACAMTGSGKTGAFLLPIVHRLMDKPRGTTRCLILTPVRELAAQIVDDLNDLAVHTPITGAAIFGGASMAPQEHAFRSGVDILVATPGRLLDHFRSSYARLSGLEYLVLDEADRMLDMGFLPEIRRVLRHLPPKRQTFFFSATMPAPIAALSREMLHDPAIINLQRTAAPATGITQAVYPVSQSLKPLLVARLLETKVIDDALVFTRTKIRADRLARFLVSQGINAERIHGNRSQAQRTAALAGFKRGKIRVLVATDIAARGIDVEALGHVVNFDVPLAPEDYIHRVGRTGRAELTGYAFTFVSPEEEKELVRIERVLAKRLPRVTVPDFDYAAQPPPRVRQEQTRGAPGARKDHAQGRGQAASRPRDGRSQSKPRDRQGPPRSRGGQGAPSGHGREKPTKHRPPTSSHRREEDVAPKRGEETSEYGRRNVVRRVRPRGR